MLHRRVFHCDFGRIFAHIINLHKMIIQALYFLNVVPFDFLFNEAWPLVERKTFLKSGLKVELGRIKVCNFVERLVVQFFCENRQFKEILLGIKLTGCHLILVDAFALLPNLYSQVFSKTTDL